MTQRFAAASDWLLRSGVAVAAALLFLNDTVLKTHYANWFTGKLSDFTGLYLVPFGVLACIALARDRWSRSRTLQLAVIAVVGLVFTVVKVIPVGAATYGQLIGWLRAPVRWALTSDGSWEALSRPIEVLVDPTDLLALSVLVIVFVELRRKRHGDVPTEQPATHDTPPVAAAPAR